MHGDRPTLRSVLEVHMRGPKPPVVILTDAERQALEQLARRHSTAQQVALRARLILAAAEGASNRQIARAEGIDIETVRLWRSRWLGLQAVTLEDPSRRGALDGCAALGPARAHHR
jgi:hypothetical protein